MLIERKEIKILKSLERKFEEGYGVRVGRSRGMACYGEWREGKMRNTSLAVENTLKKCCFLSSHIQIVKISYIAFMRDLQVTIFPNLLKKLSWEYLSSKNIF